MKKSDSNKPQYNPNTLVHSKTESTVGINDVKKINDILKQLTKENKKDGE